jgi:hypothetical protein
MPNKDGVIKCFWMMVNAGISKPPIWRSTDEATAIDAMAGVYCQLLGDLTDEQLFAAATAYCRGSASYWPSAGQLLALAPSGSGKVLCAATDWGEVIEATRQNGPTQLPDCQGDRVREQAIAAGIRGCGGIEWLEDMTDQRVNSMRHAFIAGYEAFVANVRTKNSFVIGLGVAQSSRQIATKK